LSRYNQVEALLRDILETPASGTFLDTSLPGWRVRHGGEGRRITIVFRFVEAGDCLQIALVAFGGQDWMGAVSGRSEGFEGG